ncbi:HAMP domain-containing protein [Acidovorax sp. SUPP1855]|uniref:ATP-binding protein n=1 Tax=Acidovorax sp. SUPP1855 TaxID=431774 RepID=UPI0023DE5246|nr:ATP-binding protein [Acidovorax sp. SUPP1855]GKS83058.1 HAMP domain-containing protein [Acidovorax sp. SUPP1855]
MSAPAGSATGARRVRWPRSLLGRQWLLVAALVVLGQLCAAWVARQMVLRPRAEQVAEGVARHVDALRAGLAALPPAQRAAFTDAFNRRARQLAGTAAGAAPGARPSPVERTFMQAVERRLAADPDRAGAATAPRWRRDEAGGLVLRVSFDGADHWLGLPGLFPTREATGAWLMATVAGMLLALAAAWWLQRHLHRPLARVVAAARRIARGQPPPTLPEEGPEELATVSRSINAMALALARADHDRALMLAGVSHDLRTPLTKLRLGVEIAQPRLDGDLAASMARSIDEMDAIVGQFLDFARVGEAETPVRESLDALADAVAQAQADHGRTVRVEPGGAPPLPLRPQALRRAVDNLVENAWRHGAAPVVLRTGGAAQGAAAWIEVQDGGPGIAPQDLARVREPFARGGAARSGSPGAGLGLAIVERVARAHGGTLELHGAPGQGLRARIVLPRENGAGGLEKD